MKRKTTNIQSLIKQDILIHLIHLIATRTNIIKYTLRPLVGYDKEVYYGLRRLKKELAYMVLKKEGLNLYIDELNILNNVLHLPDMPNGCYVFVLKIDYKEYALDIYIQLKPFTTGDKFWRYCIMDNWVVSKSMENVLKVISLYGYKARSDIMPTIMVGFKVFVRRYKQEDYFINVEMGPENQLIGVPMPPVIDTEVFVYREDAGNIMELYWNETLVDTFILHYKGKFYSDIYKIKAYFWRSDACRLFGRLNLYDGTKKNPYTST